MIEREKMICAIERAKRQSEEYVQDRIFVPFREADMIISLLKEQEPVEPHVEHDSEDDSWYYGCGACHEAIDYKDKFCRHCGREVKWDE